MSLKNFKAFNEAFNQRFLEMRALNSAMKSRLESGKFTISTFDEYDAALIVCYYCKKYSNRFQQPRIYVSKSTKHPFVVAKVGSEMAVIDPVALSKNELGNPVKLLEDVYKFPGYGRDFEIYDYDSFQSEFANRFNIDNEQAESATEELRFMA